MDNEFKEWLKKDNDFSQWLKDNPESFPIVYKHFQHEQVMSNPDEWVKWMAKYPELAEKQYPVWYNVCVENAKNAPSFEFANIIDGIPGFIPNWLDKANKCLPTQRIKELEQVKELLNIYIEIGESSTDEAIKAAYNENKESINEGLEIVIKTIQEAKGKALSISNIETKVPIKKTALFMVFNGETMGKTKGESPTKLYNTFKYYSEISNRKGIPPNCTAKILHNKIRLFEEVIEMLPETKKAKAKDELKILWDRYNSEYQ